MHTILKTETKAKTIDSVCVISTVMINKKTLYRSLHRLLSSFSMDDQSCAFISSSDLRSDSASKQGSFVSPMIVYFVYFGPRIIQILR